MNRVWNMLWKVTKKKEYDEHDYDTHHRTTE